MSQTAHEINLVDEVASQGFATQLAQWITAPLVLAFSGHIGAGKTTLIRAMLQNLGVTSAIKSPTFSLVESYQCSTMWVHHFDLYRIHQPEELEYIGFRDYFTPKSVCCIEWPEAAGALLPKVDITLCLTQHANSRKLGLAGLSANGQKIITKIMGES